MMLFSYYSLLTVPLQTTEVFFRNSTFHCNLICQWEEREGVSSKPENPVQLVQNEQDQAAITEDDEYVTLETVQESVRGSRVNDEDSVRLDFAVVHHKNY